MKTNFICKLELLQRLPLKKHRPEFDGFLDEQVVKLVSHDHTQNGKVALCSKGLGLLVKIHRQGIEFLFHGFLYGDREHFATSKN